MKIKNLILLSFIALNINYIFTMDFENLSFLAQIIEEADKIDQDYQKELNSVSDQEVNQDEEENFEDSFYTPIIENQENLSENESELEDPLYLDRNSNKLIENDTDNEVQNLLHFSNNNNNQDHILKENNFSPNQSEFENELNYFYDNNEFNFTSEEESTKNENLVDSKNSLIKAIINNDINKLKEILENKNNYLDIDEALLNACISSNPQIVEILLNYGANPNAKNHKNETILYYLCNYSKETQNNLSIIELLVQYGADINKKSGSLGNTPLYCAVKNEYVKIVDLLLKNGANPNLTNILNLTPIHRLSGHWSGSRVSEKSLKLVDLLVKKGSNIFSKYKNNQCPLDLAKKCKKDSIFPILYNKYIELKKEIFDTVGRADFNKIKEVLKKIPLGVYNENQDNPLHIAVLLNENEQEDWENKKNIISLILKSKIDLIFQKNKQGLTPIELATAVGNHKTLFLFISLGNNQININNNLNQNNIRTTVTTSNTNNSSNKRKRENSISKRNVKSRK